MKKLAKNNKGFSLVELIVVIAIMAVLVGVLAPQLIKYVEKSRQATDIQNCDSIATTLKTYFADKEGLKGTVTATVSTGSDVACAVPKGSTATAQTATDAGTALSDAGLTGTRLKGSQWYGDITITYNCETGQITYNAQSDNYTTGNTAATDTSSEIKPGKGVK